MSIAIKRRDIVQYDIRHTLAFSNNAVYNIRLMLIVLANVLTTATSEHLMLKTANARIGPGLIFLSR